MTTAGDDRSTHDEKRRRADLERRGYTVLRRDGGVEIEGLDPADAREALRLLGAARQLQFERGSLTASQLTQIMATADVDLTPPAAIEQARRQADHRRRMLSTPVYTYETLGELLGHAQQATTRTWVSRKRSARLLFTVKIDNQLIIPAFQLTDEGEPRQDLAGLVGPLLEAGVDGWALWTWLASSSPLLSGAVPIELVETEPQRAYRAAERFAARHRPAA
ncbi:hypothetical protein FOE78_06885 [Microlunatus elymi]|uniref:DUF2384 domain-containing protein n=1 Tax=Microlunatus elymi TaxID=2596828 RepID=A0A516PWV0_9ACTN|nr:hypothetical protein [Microlunatus elymi]QDP95667.1 hypothetical protein FOE78_06885 [Microlunatus elymi]